MNFEIFIEKILPIFLLIVGIVCFYVAKKLRKIENTTKKESENVE